MTLKQLTITVKIRDNPLNPCYLCAIDKLQNRTQMTRMMRIFTDEIRDNPLNPCYSCAIDKKK